jgi:hypothetical protein
MTDRTPYADNLASALNARQSDLGISIREMVKRGGPTKPTISRYKSGDIPRVVPPEVAAKFDRALQWPEGTFAALHEGRIVDPPEVTEPPTMPMPRARLVPTPSVAKFAPVPQNDDWRVDTSLFRELLETVQKIRQQAAELPTSPETEELRRTADRASAIQLDLLMEQFWKPDDTASEEPRETSDPAGSGVSLRFG